MSTPLTRLIVSARDQALSSMRSATASVAFLEKREASSGRSTPVIAAAHGISFPVSHDPIQGRQGSGQKFR